MKIDKTDIMYILMIPVMALFLAGFYLFLGIMIVLVMFCGGIVLLYDLIRTIDFRLNGYDKVKTNDRR